MRGRRSPEYIALKNFIHHELGYSKEEFKKLLIECIKDEAKNFVNRQMQGTSNTFIQDAFREQVAKEVNRMLNGSSYSSASRTLLETMGKELVKNIEIKPKQ